MKPPGSTPAALHIMSLIDGDRSCRDIRDAFQHDVGSALPPDTLYTLLDHLETARFLEGPGFEAFYTEKLDAFRGDAVRKSPEPSALDILQGSGDLFDELLAEVEPRTRSNPVLGLVAPHLDALRSDGIDIQLTKRDIHENKDWRQLYKLRIPVLTLDDKVIIEGNPGEDEVRQAIETLR